MRFLRISFFLPGMEGCYDDVLIIILYLNFVISSWRHLFIFSLSADRTIESVWSVFVSLTHRMPARARVYFSAVFVALWYRAGAVATLCV